MIPEVIQITGIPRSELFARVARGGAGFWVQLRSPELPAQALLALGRELTERGAYVIVNDRLDIASAIGARGVHLGRTSVSVADARSFVGQGIVTCSAHSVVEAVAREAEGADAVILSPIFASPGKPPPLGLEELARAREALSRAALIALGGIDPSRAREALAAGAHGVAAMRSDLTALVS